MIHIFFGDDDDDYGDDDDDYGNDDYDDDEDGGQHAHWREEN